MERAVTEEHQDEILPVPFHILLDPAGGVPTMSKIFKMASTTSAIIFTTASLILMMSVSASSSSSTGLQQLLLGSPELNQPGCHRVGHTRRVTIPDCVSFQLTTNACRGQCESWTVPSTWETMLKNPGKSITSAGQCCNIMASEDVAVKVMCVGGPRDFVFKSAKTCSCFHCKKD